MRQYNSILLVLLAGFSLVPSGCRQAEVSDKDEGKKAEATAPQPQAAQEPTAAAKSEESAKAGGQQQFMLTDVEAQVVEPEGTVGGDGKPRQAQPPAQAQGQPQAQPKPQAQGQYQLAEQKVEVVGGPDQKKKPGEQPQAMQLQLSEQRVNVIGGPEAKPDQKAAPQLQLTDQKVEFVGGPPASQPAGAGEGAAQLTITDQEVQVVEPIEAVPGGRPQPVKPTPQATQPAGKPDPAKPNAGKPAVAPTGGSANAARRDGPASGPRWACDETTHDFGEVWSGENVKWTFEYRNTGVQTLKILEAKPTCGCTALKDYTKSMEPGEIGKMTLVINTSKLSNAVNKAITVQTNDPEMPTMPLAMKGFVKTLFSVTPTQGASFGSVRADKPLSRKIILKNTTEDPVSLELRPIAGSKAYSAELKETVPGKEFEVTVNATPPLAKGANTANITFKTNHPKVPTYTMTANAYVQPRIQVNPPKLVVSQPADRESEWTVRIFNNGDSQLELLEFRTTEPRFRPRLVEMTPGSKHAFELKITIPKDYVPPQSAERVVIKTNDEEFGLIEIPIQPSFRDPSPPEGSDVAKWVVIDPTSGQPAAAAPADGTKAVQGAPVGAGAGPG